MINEEYYRRYTELKEIAEQGYVDYFILNGIEDYNSFVTNGQGLPKNSFNVLGHICEVIKGDLGITLCKLSDNDSKANSIWSLESYIKKVFSIYSGVSFSKETKNTINVLRTIRNHGLAHNDLIKNGETIEIEVLKRTLDEMRNKLNSLCIVEIDERVKPINDSTIFSLQFNVSLGMHWIVQHSVVPIEEDNNRGASDA